MAEPTPSLTWMPQYMGHGGVSLPAVMLAGSLVCAPVALAAPPAGDPILAQVYAGRQIQYQALARPVQPIAPTPRNIDEWGQPPSQPYVPFSLHATLEASGWKGPTSPPDIQEPRAALLQVYPDFVLAAPRTPELSQTVWVPEHQAAEGSALDWTPRYPDWLPFPRLLEGATVLDPFPRPAAVTTVEWLPIYPDTLAHLPVPVGGLVEPASSARDLGHVGWLPWYPDAIDRRSVRVSDQRAAFVPDFLPLADLRWRAVYPDAIDRLLVQAADQRAFFDPRFLPLADLRWAPIYPDFARGLIFPAALQQALATGQTGSTIPFTDLRWASVWPDHPDRREAAPWLWPFLSLELGPVIPITDLRWQAIYPDRVLGLPRLLEFPALAFDPFPRPAVVATVEWLPVYPDWLAHLPVPPSGVTEPPSSPRDLGHLGWRPEYPDQFLVAARLSEYPAVFTGQTGSTIPITDLRWQAQFADRIDRLVATPWLWPWVVLDPFPVPTPAPDLSWGPAYPESVRRITLPVAALPVEVGPLLIPRPRVPLRITPAPREVVSVAQLQERSSAIYWALLQDEAEHVVPGTALISLVLSLYVRASDGTITYLRNHQDALNANGVTVYNAIQMRSDGLLYNLRWAINPLDTGMVDPTKAHERHVALWEYVWANGRGKHELVLNIHNLLVVN